MLNRNKRRARKRKQQRKEAAKARDRRKMQKHARPMEIIARHNAAGLPEVLS